MTNTTENILDIKSNLKFYQTLEIKRRTADYTYETNWYNVTKYLLNSDIEISKKLDFEIEELGQTNTGNINIKVDNTLGDWFDEKDYYSIFSEFYSRDRTKVRYTAGYYDTDNSTKIDEVVFEGLLDEKTVVTNYMNGVLTFTALNYNTIFENKIIDTGDLSGLSTIKNIIDYIFSNYIELYTYITYSSTNINPAFDISFDDISVFEQRTVLNVLQDILRKSNSVYYIDNDNNIIVRDKEVTDAITTKPAESGKPIGSANDGGDSKVNAGFYTAIYSDYRYEFKKGNDQNKNINVIEIENFDSGFRKLINTVKYTNSAATYIRRDSDSVLRYGENILELAGDDITNTTTITSLSNGIINKYKTPKMRATFSTVYMPNIVDFYDKISLEIGNNVKYSDDKPILVINGYTFINDGYYTGYYNNRNRLRKTPFEYIGYNHLISEKKTIHYIIEV